MLRDSSPLTMVYLSWGEQRPITLSDGHNALKLSLSMDPSALTTRSLNSGPDNTAPLPLGAPLTLPFIPAQHAPEHLE